MTRINWASFTSFGGTKTSLPTPLMMRMRNRCFHLHSQDQTPGCGLGVKNSKDIAVVLLWIAAEATTMHAEQQCLFRPASNAICNSASQLFKTQQFVHPWQAARQPVAIHLDNLKPRDYIITGKLPAQHAPTQARNSRLKSNTVTLEVPTEHTLRLLDNWFENEEELVGTQASVLAWTRARQAFGSDHCL